MSSDKFPVRIVLREGTPYSSCDQSWEMFGVAGEEAKEASELVGKLNASRDCPKYRLVLEKVE